MTDDRKKHPRRRRGRGRKKGSALAAPRTVPLPPMLTADGRKDVPATVATLRARLAVLNARNAAADSSGVTSTPTELTGF